MSFNTELPLWSMILALVPVGWGLISLYFGHKALLAAHKEKTEMLKEQIKEKVEQLEKSLKEKIETLSVKVKETEDNVWLVKDEQKDETQRIEKYVSEISSTLKSFTEKMEMLIEGRIIIKKQEDK